MTTPRILRLHGDDNVAVAVDRIAQGITVLDIMAREPIPRGHKITLYDIEKGQPILKYGQIIGFAKDQIKAGMHVHDHNLIMGDLSHDFQFAEQKMQLRSPTGTYSFNGYRRENGKIGTRNYIGILTSVNCSASAARFIAERVKRSNILADYPNVDGVVSFVHGTGCGMAASGEGYDILERIQWGYAAHPNLAGILLVGLGCEVFQIPRMMERYGLKSNGNFRVMTIQENGGTRKTIEAGFEVIQEMLPKANEAKREVIPVSELTLALQCGGSDGYSGITANPALGIAADILVAEGGTAILSETPEIYGAEHLLTRRAESRAIGEQLIERIRWWEAYTARNGGNMNNNPSPGNKAGGLSTILEKSLGAAAKGGSSPLRGVYQYGEPINKRGFVFMDSPGYDPCSVTGQVASGATMIAFTTGRGSAFGYKPTPSIKLATNSDIYKRMQDDMDINCGDILDGVSLEEKGQEIFQKILDVASGGASKSEQLGYGDNEFVPWQIGAVM